MRSSVPLKKWCCCKVSVIDICWKCFYYILTWLLCFSYYSFVILLYIFTIQAKIFITFTNQASYLQSRATDQLHHNTKSFQVCFFLVKMLWGWRLGSSQFKPFIYFYIHIKVDILLNFDYFLQISSPSCIILLNAEAFQKWSKNAAIKLYKRHHWLQPTKSNSLRFYLHLMIIFMPKI